VVSCVFLTFFPVGIDEDIDIGDLHELKSRKICIPKFCNLCG